MVNADRQPNKINGPALIYSRKTATAALAIRARNKKRPEAPSHGETKLAARNGKASQKALSIHGSHQISKPAKR
jgi:hypothetical protein